MEIAVVGIGALGTVYALRLSHVAPVTLVVRALGDAPQTLHGDRLGGPTPHGDTRSAPPSATVVPASADVVLLAVRVDQLTEELLASIAKVDGPADRIVVVLAPLLPPTLARVREILGDQLVVSMPGVVAYEPEADAPKSERRVRYWLPRVAPTILEERAEGDPRRAKIHDLAEILRKAGLGAEVQPGVAGLNAATTIAFFPILTGIAASGGSVDRMLADDALLKLGLSATKESRALAKTVGGLPSFASLFFGFMSPWTARAGIKLGRSRAPEAIVFLEKHFGQKLKGQNAAIFRDIEQLARERGIVVDSLRKLATAAGAA
jgi:ketopantoate reductase